MYLDERKYESLLIYKGFEICALKVACPTDGEAMGYVIDDEFFSGCNYSHPEEAMKAITAEIKAGKIKKKEIEEW
ncbi:hypothetical protein [Aminipila sp.]|uniref:hypothetical protein n=1 Tax=Aminipila sp. TaxID=2060095 RepID=UPI0028A15DBD|nr:hypothetical protein [Aminipila sp.]